MNKIMIHIDSCRVLFLNKSIQIRVHHAEPITSYTGMN